VLLSEGDPFIGKLTKASQDTLRPLEPGPCVFRFSDPTRAGLADFVCAGYRSQSTVRVQMKDAEKVLLHQLFVGPQTKEKEPIEEKGENMDIPGQNSESSKL